MRKNVLGILLTGVISVALASGYGSTPSNTTQQMPQNTATVDKSDTPATADLTRHTLMIYCGAGLTKPFQEIVDSFQSATGREMNVTYVNAGQIQSQITTSEEGDLFIASSSEELKPVDPMSLKARHW